MIVVAAKMKAVEGKGDEIEREFRKVVSLFLKETGTISYTVHRKMDAPNEFFVYEKYEDRDAFKQHISSEQFKDLSKAIMPLLDGPADIGLYQELA